MGSHFNLGHLVVSELVPEILNGVESDEGSAKESNPLNTAHASDAQTSQSKPCEPLEAEALVLKSMESGPAKDSCEGEAQQHRVEKNESADSRVGVFAENHKSDEPDSWSLEVELPGSVVGQRDTDGTEEGIERTHERVVQLLGVSLSRLKFERAIVSSQVSREPYEHLS